MAEPWFEGQCRSCGGHARYNDKKHRYTCECGNSWAVLPMRRQCFNCHTEYIEYTQGDPSGCSHCKKTFVD